MQFAVFIMSIVSVFFFPPARSVSLRFLSHVRASTLNIDKFNLGFQNKYLKNQGGTDNPG